jgi:hypothetical protein
MVLLEFESLEMARAWLESAEYAPARAVRHRTARTRMIATEGVAPAAAARAATVRVFFYGLFMDGEALRAKGLHPLGSRRACVPGRALRIGRRATLVPDLGGCVHGMLIDLERSELEELYAEPTVAAYRPEAILAMVADGSWLPALCYVLPESDEPPAPNPAYAEELRRVASRLGLPPDYVAGIR